MVIENGISRYSGIGLVAIMAIIVAIAIIGMIALGIVIHFEGKPLFMIPG
jgi:hypothetical protein